MSRRALPRAGVLVVDDHPGLATNIVELLQRGVRDVDVWCRVAATGTEALAIADETMDVALLDLHLPDAHGAELMHELHRRSPFAQLVVITGDASVESAIGAIDRGASSYVVKPFSPEDLLEKVRRAIDRAHLLREREALRIELERSEQRHRSIIESVPAFVLALDEQGRIQFWNRKLEEVTGHPRHEMLSRPGAEVMGGTDGDWRLPVSNGGYRLVRWHRSSVSLAPGEAPLTFAVGVDVTEERENQRRAIRTERLAAIGRLAAGLAHEVRNPLNSASLQLQVLERRLARGQARPEALQSVVSIVHNEIRRLDRLVNEFLAFARPSPLNLEPLAVNDSVSKIVDLVRPECDSLGLAVTIDLDSAVGTIQADEERVRQVLLNIVRNAIEAMPAGGSLTIRTRAADENGFVRIDVDDTGPGFPENAPVFDAFYTTKENGTGLGLSIVHSIVTDHGGSVQVDSSPGRTRFSVNLPQAGQ